MLKYNQKERSPAFETYDFPLLQVDKDGKDVKHYVSVNKYDGSKENIHLAIRDTYEPFREIADDCGWTEKQKIKEFRKKHIGA